MVKTNDAVLLALDLHAAAVDSVGAALEPLGLGLANPLARIVVDVGIALELAAGPIKVACLDELVSAGGVDPVVLGPVDRD